MEINELGIEIAKGIVATGIEGAFDNFCCSTAGDKICIGVSSWENSRADAILTQLNGGDKFIGRSYSDIVNSGEADELSALLDTDEGHNVQLATLGKDCENYAQAVIDAGLTDARCVIYAGMWCPTSDYIVSLFIKHRLERGYDISANIDNLNDTFYNEYATAAGCDDYTEGYQNRATNTYNYTLNLDLSAYGY